MEQMIQNWANRYYYTGMGLSAPATLPANNKYEESFKMNLSDPVTKLLKKETVSLNEVAEFLREYQKLGIKAPFYTLSYFADHYNGGDWQSEIKAMLGKMEVVVAVVKDGKAMHVYRIDGKIAGTFPRTPHYIGSTDMAAQGEDIINTLLFKDGATLSNDEIQALKRLARISNDYAASVKEVAIEHYDGDRISSDPISPLHPNFPPYEVRQLFNNLPTANPFSTRHEQAYDYAQHSKDVDPVAKKYLERVATVGTQTAKDILVSTPVGEVTVSQEFADKMQNGLVGFPDTNEVFSDVGEMLAHLVKTDYIGMDWSIRDAIKYYSLPDTDPFCPIDRYDFDASGITMNNKYVLYEALSDFMKHVDNPSRPMTVANLIEELNSDKDNVPAQNTWDILHACMVLLNVNNNRDVASLKGKEKTFDQQLQRQSANFIKQGFPAELTLQEAAQGYTQPQEKSISLEALAASAISAGCSMDTTVQDMQNGMTEHFKERPKVYNSIQEIIDAGLLSAEGEQQYKAEIANLNSKISQLEDSLLNLYFPDNSDEQSKKADEYDKLTERLNQCTTIDEVEACSLLPKEFRVAVGKLRSSHLDLKAKSVVLEEKGAKLDRIFEAAGCDTVMAVLDIINNPTPNVEQAPTANEFGQAAAEAMLRDIRQGIAQSESLPFKEAMQVRSAYVPVYYAFIRLVGCGSKDLKDMIEFLTAQHDKTDNQNTKDIFKHGIEVLNTFM